MALVIRMSEVKYYILRVEIKIFLGPQINRANMLCINVLCLSSCTCFNVAVNVFCCMVLLNVHVHAFFMQKPNY